MILPVDKKLWPPIYYQTWAERAAIKQFESEMPQDQAEKEAELEIRRVAERGQW